MFINIISILFYIINSYTFVFIYLFIFNHLKYIVFQSHSNTYKYDSR